MTWLFTLLLCHAVAELFFLHLHEFDLLCYGGRWSGSVQLFTERMIVPGNHSLRGVTHTIWFAQDILDFNP